MSISRGSQPESAGFSHPDIAVLTFPAWLNQLLFIHLLSILYNFVDIFHLLMFDVSLLFNLSILIFFFTVILEAHWKKVELNTVLQAIVISHDKSISIAGHCLPSPY